MPVDENGRPYHPLFSPNQPQGSNTLGPLGSIGGTVGGAIGGGLGGLFGRRGSQFGAIDPQGHIAGQAGQAGRFADIGQGGYVGMTDQLAQDREHLRRLQSGQDSISAEQLRQGLQQNLAAQRSMAASAAPGNAAMAARTGAIQSARLGSGMAGQQALAGIAERNAATQALGQMNLGERGQDLQAALGSRQNSLQGYGALEQARTGRYQADLGVPTTGEQVLGAGAGILGFKLMSDRRLKKDIKSGDRDAADLVKGLKAYKYRYRDEKHGKGEFLGPMAQDLAKTKLGRQAVVETPDGLAVDGGRLATALAAALPGMQKRIERLEKK